MQRRNSAWLKISVAAAPEYIRRHAKRCKQSCGVAQHCEAGTFSVLVRFSITFELNRPEAPLSSRGRMATDYPVAGETLFEKARRLGADKEVTVHSRACPVKLRELIRPDSIIRGYEKKSLEEFANVALKKAGEYSVLLGEKGTDCGRLYAKDYKTASAITMRGTVRGTLFGAEWIEVDIEACHPGQLRFMASKYIPDTPIPTITAYLAERKEWLSGVAKAFRISQADAKQCFNAALYGSRVKEVEGDDGVIRQIFIPWEGDPDDVHRARLSNFTEEVRNVTDRILRDPVVKEEHKDNLKRARDGRPSSKLFKLLEVGERLAILALQHAIKETRGKVIPGDIIYDGMLVRLRKGGSPASWDLSALCADASAKAKELFGMEVSFKAKPLAKADIFPIGRDGTTTAMLDKGCIFYAPIHADHAPFAAKRAEMHAAKRGHRFVLVLQTSLGPRYAAHLDWEGLRAWLRCKESCVWEMARSGVPMRPWVYFEGCDGDIAAFQDAMRATAASCFGQDVASASTFTVTTEGNTRFALVMHLNGDVRSALADFGTVLAFNQLTFKETELATKLLYKNRLLMVGQSPFGRRADMRCICSTPDSSYLEEGTYITATKDATVYESQQLMESPSDANNYEPWESDYLEDVNRSLPDVVDEKTICTAIMRHCAPGNVAQLYDAHVIKAVARALWAASSEEDEAAAADKFMDWATEGGASFRNSRDAINAIWEDATRASDSGTGDLVLVREMVDLMSHRAPELHAAFIASMAGSLTGGPAPETKPPPFVTLRFVTKDPGPNSIGSEAHLLSEYKYLATQAETGFGKTEGHLATLRESRPDSVCSVTTRRTVAHSMTVRYNGAGLHLKYFHYQDESFGGDAGARSEVDHIICELESIASLGRTYDHLLLDEFMSILMQVASDINRGRFRRLCKALKDLAQNAKNVIVADALLTMSAFESFVNIVEGGAHKAKALYTVYRPRVPSGRNIVIRSTRSKFKADDIQDAFAERFKAGEKNLFVFTNIKKLVPTIVAAHQAAWTAAGREGSPKVLTIDSSTVIPKGITTDEWWGGYDLVVVTPTITNSVSYNKENIFSSVMAFCTNMSCIPPEVLQGCGRVRHPMSKVVHMYISKTFNGATAPVKSYHELCREAQARDHNATDMEKLCYRLSIRAKFFSINFFVQYIAACFKANGFGVTMDDTPMSGKKPMLEGPLAPFIPYSEVPLATHQHFTGVIKDTCGLGGVPSESDAMAALEIMGVPDDDRGGGVVTLLAMKNRHIFARNLLNIEHGAETMTLTGEQQIARDKLWAQFSSDQSPLWAARRSYLYEYFSGNKMLEKIDEAFKDNCVTPWSKKFEIVRKALQAVGLPHAFPCTATSIGTVEAYEVSRKKLESAYDDLAALARGFSMMFGKQPSIRISEESTNKEKDAAAIMKDIVNAWNPKVTFKVAESRKRARAGGERGDVTPYILTFTKDSNRNGEMDLLHSINMRLLN